jgi:aconitate hydratase 2/2-methylisocitrate dehydratase
LHFFNATLYGTCFTIAFGYHPFQHDADAEYHTVLDIDISAIKEPIMACPNDPDDVKTLSDVAGTKIDEVFLGSCMTNIGHFRAAGRRSQINKSAIT